MIETRVLLLVFLAIVFIGFSMAVRLEPKLVDEFDRMHTCVGGESVSKVYKKKESQSFNCDIGGSKKSKTKQNSFVIDTLYTENTSRILKVVLITDFEDFIYDKKLRIMDNKENLSPSINVETTMDTENSCDKNSLHKKLLQNTRNGECINVKNSLPSYEINNEKCMKLEESFEFRPICKDINQDTASLVNGEVRKNSSSSDVNETKHSSCGDLNVALEDVVGVSACFKDECENKEENLNTAHLVSYCDFEKNQVVDNEKKPNRELPEEANKSLGTSNIEPHTSYCDLEKNKVVDDQKKPNIELLEEANKSLDTSNIEPHTSPVSTPQVTITQSMLDEEIKCKQEKDSDPKNERQNAVDTLHQATQKQRYDRLQVLLNRSQIYAKYLLNRINARSENEQKRKVREEKKKKKLKEKEDSIESCEKPDGEPLNKGKRKRDNENNIDITNYIDKSELENRVKRQKLDVQNLDEDEKCKSVPAKPNHSDSFSRVIDGKKVSDRQPLLLAGGVMREYQLEGMEWLRGLFEHGINGILADEMGLGKTIQSISLIVSLIEQNIVGPFLIAAPLSTLSNWVAEFNKFAPEIKVMLYHGSIQERARLRRKLMRRKRYSTGHTSFPVVVSSYEMLMRDRMCLSAYNIEWKYLIVDEGHRIKNLNCKLIRELKLYKTANRLLLTGTPLQNNLSELWSLLNFLLPDIFDDLSSFQSWFDFSAVEDADNEKLIAQEQEARVLQTLHSILTPFLLRRLKTDVDLSIPPKKEVIVYAPLTAQQELFYKSTLDRTIIDMLNKKNNPSEENVELTPSGRPKRRSCANKIKYKESDSQEFDLDKLIEEVEDHEKRVKEAKDEKLLKEKKNVTSIVNIRLQNIMMQLRKCCNHPFLLEHPFDPATQELVIDERMVTSSGKLLLLDKMLSELKKTGHKVLLFSQMTQMMDILQDYCFLRKFSFSRIDGSMNIIERQENIKRFNEDHETFLFLLSTRAGGLGLNLMSADTCIIYDSDWNPQADLQAQDRCHRIGQTRPVVVYRLVTANTVDQRIIERAASKRKLEKMVIHKKNFKGRGIASAVTPRELLELLESKDANSVDAVISEEHLKRLLDRSDMDGWQNKNDNEKRDSVAKETHDVDKKAPSLFKVVESTMNEDVLF